MKELFWPVTIRSNEEVISYQDVAGLSFTLEDLAPRLFGDQIEIEACRLERDSLEGEFIDTFEALKDFLESSEQCHVQSLDPRRQDSGFTLVDDDCNKRSQSTSEAQAEIIFLRQKHSRSRLAITQQALDLILCQYRVFPDFANILTAFTAEDGPYNEGKSGFYTSHMTKVPPEQNEVSYMLKYVELHGRSSNIIPWSVRQMAIYQKEDTRTHNTKNVIIQASGDLKRRIQEVAGSPKMVQDFTRHWTSFHMLLLGSLNRNWAAYIKCLDVEVDKLHNSLRFATTNPVTYENLQAIHNLSDLLLRLPHAPKFNLDVLRMLEKASQRRAEHDITESKWRYKLLEAAIESSVSENMFICSHADLVRTRAISIVAMMRDSIALRDGQIMKDLAHLSKQESSAMLNLGKKSTRDANTMKTITLVTLVYLPATFTSTFLSMGFVHVSSEKDGLVLNVSRDMWFYLALTLPLMVATLAGWYLWEMRAHRRERMNDIEDNPKNQ